MYADNFFNHDPTHIFSAKYYIESSVLKNAEGVEYSWESFSTFKCKPVEPRYSRYLTANNGYQPVSPDSVFLETKWAGIDYKVGDYVEYRDVKYQIKGIKKDDLRVNPQVLLFLKNNPNTYYILEMEQVKNVIIKEEDSKC